MAKTKISHPMIVIGKKKGKGEVETEVFGFREWYHIGDQVKNLLRDWDGEEEINIAIKAMPHAIELKFPEDFFESKQ